MRTKRFLGVCLTLCMIFTILSVGLLTAFAADDLTVTIDTGASVTLKDNEGDGYYDIGTADELYAFAVAVNSGKTNISGELTADIVVNENVLTEDGNLNGDGSNFREWIPIGSETNQYTGTFNGEEHTISGLYFNSTTRGDVGLFGVIKEPAIIKNVGVIDTHFSGLNYVGGVVSYMYSGVVENCYNTGEVSGRNEVGGVISGLGFPGDSVVANCYNLGKISGIQGVGGVVGRVNVGTIENCYNKGDVSGDGDVGGVVGETEAYGSIKNCYNAGDVSGDEAVGGVVGRVNIGTIENCYNKGDVSGDKDVGGVVGRSASDSIENCYYLEDTAEGGINKEDVAGQAEAMTVAQFSSGEVAYLLGEAFGQTLGENSDAYPVFINSKNTNKVYRDVDCATGKATYSNDSEKNRTGDHSFTAESNGICTVCGQVCDHGGENATYDNGICDICGDVLETIIVKYDKDKQSAIVTVKEAGTYSLIFAKYGEGNRLDKIDIVEFTFEKGINTVPQEIADFTLGTDDKIMLWQDMTNLVPRCEAYIVK